MPGIGKTTLAHFVYKHMSINFHFHVRAWCYVSHVYEKNTLLAELLCQTTGETKSHGDNRKDSAYKLYKSLKGKRYLVVLDDIWELKAWNDLMNCFPDDGNGSRILITTRQQTVAVLTNSIHHSLKLLSCDEIWKLLQDSIFQKESCPPELIEVAKSIAKNCKGLPLLVVLVAGLLKKTERKRDCWEQVAKQLGANEVAYIYRERLTTLELSYMYLPDYLKPCFLYLGSFSQYREIPARKLLRLWIAEGFVQQPKMAINSLEHEAENYLNDLVDRSLVMIAKRGSTGRIKACRIHDLLLDFCLAKAERQSTMHQLAGYLELSGSSSSLVHSTDLNSRRIPVGPRPPVPSLPSQMHILRPDGYFAPNAVKASYTARNTHPHSTANGDGPLLFTASSSSSRGKQSHSAKSASDPRRRSFKQLSFNHFESQFRLLKVLDLENIPGGGWANTHDLILIAQLVELRYLAVRILTKEIPPEIANLCNLENFIVRGAIGEVILPEAIWYMVRLKHIHIIGAFFRFQHYSQEYFDKNPFGMSNLKTISTVSLNHGSNVSTIMLGRLSGLQKLRCIFTKCWDNCNSFPELSCLSQLESLKVCFSGKVHGPSKFSFHANLKKLTLSRFQLPWNEISAIGRLPNLEVLKLLDRAFEGQQWEMNEGEFQNLKFLKLDLLNISTWIVSSEHLPSLEQLVLHRCKLLQELPSGLGEILTLQVIEMKGCSPSAMDSVWLIQKEQSDLGNNQLEICI